METGSNTTASATAQSYANGDFPALCELSRTSGSSCEHFVSAKCRFDIGSHSRLNDRERTGYGRQASTSDCG
jgi:hypothetical protein